MQILELILGPVCGLHFLLLCTTYCREGKYFGLLRNSKTHFASGSSLIFWNWPYTKKSREGTAER